MSFGYFQNPGAWTQLGQLILCEKSGQDKSWGFRTSALPGKPLLQPPPTHGDATSRAPSGHQDQCPGSFKAKRTLSATDAENKEHCRKDELRSCGLPPRRFAALPQLVSRLRSLSHWIFFSLSLSSYSPVPKRLINPGMPPSAREPFFHPDGGGGGIEHKHLQGGVRRGRSPACW